MISITSLTSLMSNKNNIKIQINELQYVQHYNTNLS